MSARYDVLGLGNAVVDVLAHVDDAFLRRHRLCKGVMNLVSRKEADRLAALMPSARQECCGGAAANTAAGIASLGGRAAFIGKVKDDRLGRVFIEEMAALGVSLVAKPVRCGAPTAHCLVLVTPDAQRTMQTFLGASVSLAPSDIEDEVVARAGIVYLEGYLWTARHGPATLEKTALAARAKGRRVAFALADRNLASANRDSLTVFLREHVDILFANEGEACALAGVGVDGADEDGGVSVAHDRLVHDAAMRLGRLVPLLVVTRSARGSLIVADSARHDIAARVLGRVEDTTGAGDLYAAGFLYALGEGAPLPLCGALGALAAAEVIGHVGARPSCSLAALRRAHGL